jgi:hypothetical protein
MSANTGLYEMLNVKEEFRVEFMFKTKNDMTTFLNKIYRWNETEKQKHHEKEFIKNVKHFQMVCHIPSLKEAKKKYLEHLEHLEQLEHLGRVENVKTDNITIT